MKTPSARHRLLRRVRCATLPLALLAALPGAAQPLRVDYVVGAWLLHTDNINLSETVPESETVLSPEIAFTASQASSTTTFRATGRVQHLNYLEHTYGNEFRSEFAGQFAWMAIPERLSFVVEDYLGRQPIDFASGYSPGNQQQANVFTAGPSLYARLGDAMRGQVDLRYSRTHAEETREFNGDRYIAGGRLFRDLGPDQWVSLNIDASRVRFDLRADQADYDRYDAYVRYRRESAHLGFDASAGYSRLEQDGGAGRASAPLARMQLDWQVAPRSVLSATAAYQFSDTAADLIADGARLDALVIGDVVRPTGLVDPTVYRQRRYELGYRYTGERWSYQVRPYSARVDYDRPTLVGWDLRGGYADARVQLRPRLDLTASAMLADRDFLDGSRDDRDTMLSLGLDYQFNSHLTGALSWARLERESSVPGQDYREDSVTVGIRYRR